MLTLEAGDCRLIVCPKLGGAVGGWTWRGIPVLRHTPDEALHGTTSRALSCYPLIPFSNRIAYGRFSFGGETFQLDPNFDDELHAIHGNAWQRAWTVEGHTREGHAVEASHASEAELSLAHDPRVDTGSHWPFCYQAGLRYALSPTGLTVTVSLHNTDHRSQPVGLGLHPYQPRTPQTTIEFKAASVWHTGVNSLPDERLPVKGHWSFDPARAIAPPPLDNCYAAWTGRAEITRPEHGLRLAISADDVFRHLVVYTPESQPYFAVEPASNMTDAVNRMDTVPDHGLRVLAPGERLVRQVRFVIEPLV